MAIGLVCYAGYAWTAMVRLGLLDRPSETALGLVGLAALLALGLTSPVATSAVMLVLVPFVGNHPGGRLVELINLPLAAGAAGLALQARARREPVPLSAIWIAAALYAISAVVSLVPALPGVWVRVAQLDAWPTIIADALTAPEDNPLYSVASAVGVTLCVTWASAFAWRRPAGLEYFVRALLYVFFIVVGLGILNHFGAVSLVQSYMLRIDPRRPDVNGFQSVFWNPGWFAWYFVMLFGLGLGCLWSVRGREKWVVGSLLAIAYAFFFLNPQRGGLLALHLCMAVAGLIALRNSTDIRLARRLMIATVVLTMCVVGGAYAFDLIPRGLQSSIFRLVAQPEEATVSNSIRVRLWTAAFQMWQGAPVFGIGEGAFGWRYGEFVSPESALYSSLHGDAHSTWMQILSTRGSFGFLAFIALMLAVGRALVASRRRGAATTAPVGLTIGLALSFIAFLVYSVVQGMFYIQGIQILFWFLVSVAAMSHPTGSIPLRRWHIAAAVLVLAGALVVEGSAARPLFAEAASRIERQPRGFYPAERSGNLDKSWRWTTGKEGTLCVQPLRPHASITLAAGDPRTVAYPRTVTLKINDTLVRELRVPDGAAVTTVVPMPVWDPGTATPETFGECTGQPNEVRLTVRVDATWNPLAEGIAPEPRTLGVQVFEPVWDVQE